jgi:hypothetical protein
MASRGKHYTGTFPSLKNKGENVAWVGHLQRDLCFFLEFDPLVRAYRSRPFEVILPSAGRQPRVRVFDMHITRTTGEQLVVCEYTESAAQPETQQEFEVMGRWAHAHGYDFGVVTDRELRTGSRLANLILIWRYAPMPIPSGMTRRIVSFVQARPLGTCINDVAAMLAEADADNPRRYDRYIYRLIFDHRLMSNMDAPLMPESPIWLPSVGEWITCRLSHRL